MKPFYVVILMGAAAIGGGLVVRYSDHPVQITMAHPVPPPVVAPPIPPRARVGPSSSVPVQEAPPEGVPAAKPSAFSLPVHVSRLEPGAAEPKVVEPRHAEPRPTARVRIPPDPPAVIPLERSSDPAPTKLAALTPPKVVDSPPPAGVLRTADEPNHATLKTGMLISVRINQALSSNTNSSGDVFSGTLERPLIADGFVIAERGAPVRGEVVDAKSDGRNSELTIRLREILASDGQRVHVVSNPWRKLSTGNDVNARNIYEVPLTRGGAAVIRPATSVTFRLDESVELTEKR